MTFNLFIFFVIIIVTCIFDRVEIYLKKIVIATLLPYSLSLPWQHFHFSFYYITNLIMYYYKLINRAYSCKIILYSLWDGLYYSSYMNFATTHKSCIFYFIQIQLNEHHVLSIIQTHFIYLFHNIQCKRMIIESNGKNRKSQPSQV